MNPIAVVTILFGVGLLLLGLFLTRKHHLAIGIVLSLLGAALMAAPLLATFFIAR